MSDTTYCMVCGQSAPCKDHVWYGETRRWITQDGWQPTPYTRAPDLAEQLQAFNEQRRVVLSNRPIDPEGERALGRLLFDPPEEDGQHPRLDR